MAFCDWISGFINLDVPHFHNGWFCEVTPDKKIAYKTSKPLSVEGSYSDKVLVKSCALEFVSGSREQYSDSVQKWRVYISGNPTKFLQGHNVYGHVDMIACIRDFFKEVLDILGVDRFTIERVVMSEPIFITRIDVTTSYVMESPSDVTAWLRAASQYMTGKNQKVDNEKTLYIGKHSRRVSIKVYEKASEMLAHKKKKLFRSPLKSLIDFIV